MHALLAVESRCKKPPISVIGQTERATGKAQTIICMLFFVIAERTTRGRCAVLLLKTDPSNQHINLF